MSLTRIDSHYRLTLTSEVRKYVKVRKGQSVYVLPRSNSLIVIPLSIDADSEIDRLIGDVPVNALGKTQYIQEGVSPEVRVFLQDVVHRVACLNEFKNQLNRDPRSLQYGFASEDLGVGLNRHSAHFKMTYGDCVHLNGDVE